MRIIAEKKFNDDVTYYIKRKKYVKIRQDILPVVSELSKGNLVGNKLDNLSLPFGDVYKVRIANSSVNEGKSNGFRLLYYVVLDDTIYLLTIYSKKDDKRVLNDAQISVLAKNLISDVKTPKGE